VIVYFCCGNSLTPSRSDSSCRGFGFGGGGGGARDGEGGGGRARGRCEVAAGVPPPCQTAD
jgi:hypothetical protein